MNRHHMIGLVCGLALVLSSCKLLGILPQQETFLPDAYEPNDTLAEARALQGVIEGRIQEYDPPDMYFFNLEAGQRAKFVLQWQTNTNAPKLELFDPNGVSLGSFVRLSANGTYRFVESDPKSSLQAFPETLEFVVSTTGKYTVSLSSYLTECPPEAGCPTGRSSYALQLEKLGQIP